MKFYSIMPIDMGSPSRRWFVDDIGLDKVKGLYSNHKGRNRLHEFKIEETKEVGFDFGGMMRVNTPIIEEVVYNCVVCLPVTHLEYFLESLETDVKDGVYQCGLRFWNYVFSLETRDILLNLFKSKMSIYEEMIEGYKRDLEEIYKSGVVIKGKSERNSDG